MVNNSDCISFFRFYGLECPIEKCNVKDVQKCALFNLYSFGGPGTKSGLKKIDLLSEKVDALKNDIAKRIIHLEQQHIEDIKKISEIICELRNIVSHKNDIERTYPPQRF